VELIAPPDVTNHSDDAPDADVFDDPTTNPRAELEALERAHLLIANGAAQRILEHQYEIEALRPIVFEHRAKAAVIRRLVKMLPEGGDEPHRLGQANFDALKPAD
jgi:hypothetical protein